ncbi:MAG: VCBS repeat-containing protein, partial [Verrucomicrobiae bacterium]|nr:VCBS repeat-containing protein [Verrucomicrobiae bacterium]
MNQQPTRRSPGHSTLCICLVFLVAVFGSNTIAQNYTVQKLSVPSEGKPGFTLMPPELTGVWFTNTLSPEHAAENQIRLNGSGVALGDVDGDGWCDLFACAYERPLALYRNLGDWHFTNVTEAAGLNLPGNYSTGATFADVDGDRDLDLLINGIGTGTKLFLNDGKGHFTFAADSGLAGFGGAMTSTLADIDGDGDLDLYVTNYRTNTVRSTGFALINVGGRRMIAPEYRGQLELTPDGRILEHGEPDFLYLNDGKGHFRPVPWVSDRFLDEQGKPLREAPRDWGLSAAFRDINGDGVPDLYVCNDFHSPDRIWINNGQGRFRALPVLAIRHTATFSMAVDFADVDRDGYDDILVSDMTSLDRGRRLMQIAGMAPYSISVGVFDDRPQLDRTVLFWNRGDGTYAEIAHYAGLENSEWNWSVLFLDVDLDGFEDVLAATGHMYDTQDLDAHARIQAAGPYPRSMIPKKLLMLPPLAQPKLAFRNRGNLTFVECGKEWGFDQVGVAHGMALADLDNDGDLDLVLN